MSDVGAANVEQPRQIVRVADQEPVGALQRFPRALDFGGCAFAGEAAPLLADHSQRRLRTVAPDGVDRIRRKRDKLRSRLPAGRREPRDGVGRMESRVVPELFPRPHILADPIDRRLVDDMPQLEDRSIGLRFSLLGISPVDEQGRLILQNDGDSRRAREAGQPQEAFGARGHVLVLMLIRPRNNESGQARCFERLPQFSDARGAVRWAANVGKRLKATFKHGLSCSGQKSGGVLRGHHTTDER